MGCFVIFGLKKRNAEKVEPADDELANKLLDAVVQELVDGRSRTEIVRELLRHGWQRDAANQFTQLALQICREFRSSPEQRAACARKGAERMQAAYGWIGSGIFMALLINFAIDSLKPYVMVSWVPIVYGIVEFVSGYLLWFPHRDLLHTQPAK